MQSKLKNKGNKHLFIVDTFRKIELKTTTTLEVDLFNIEGTKEIEIKIPLIKFEKWLYENDKLNTEINYSDNRGEHVQIESTMNFYEYWNLDNSCILEDLYEYITSNPIVFRNTVFEDSVNSILSQFNK